jgi:hypothetical protein
VHPVEPQRVDQRGEVVGPVAHAPPGVDGQRVGAAVAAQVHRERPEPPVPGQREHRLLPEQRGAHVAVHEEDRLTGAGGFDAGRVQHLLGEPGCRHAGGGDAGQQDVGHAVSSVRTAECAAPDANASAGRATSATGIEGSVTVRDGRCT